MKTWRRLHRETPVFFKMVAACVLVPWLLAMAMAVSPSLHEHVHPDAGHTDHECVVTHLQAGHFGEGAVAAVVVVGFVAAGYVEPLAAIADVYLRPLYLENGVLEHGPPVR